MADTKCFKTPIGPRYLRLTPLLKTYNDLMLYRITIKVKIMKKVRLSARI